MFDKIMRGGRAVGEGMSV